MALTRSFKELVEKQAASDPAFAEALRREEADLMTPARVALLAFAKAWTYPILGNEDVPIMRRLFDDARALSKGVAASAADPPEFAGWLEVLGNKARDGSNEWEDTLHAVTDYFGLSTDC
jgi:hypothetical protein